MHRRTLSWLSPFVLLVTLLGPVGSGAAEFEEGFDYQRITPARPTQTGERIELVELFWYRCPHCYRFDPVLERWLASKSEHVQFLRIPAIARSDWAFLARAYYTAESLDMVEQIHRPLFDAIHKEKREFRNRQSMQAFFGEHGISPDQYKRAWGSDVVLDKVERAQQLARQYEISDVPTMIVNGKYRTSAVMAGGNRRLLEVVDYLVDKEERGSKSEQD